MAVITTITCLEGCEDIELPEVNFDDCNPTIKLSQFNYAYLALEGAAPFVNATTLSEWMDRLSQNATPPEGSDTEVIDLIRQLTIIGDMPAPTKATKEISGNRTLTTKTTRVINITIDEATPENFELARQTECGFFKCRMWFETGGGMMLGGNAGILGKLELNPIYGAGTDEIEKYIGTFTWDSKTSPDRFLSPITH